MSNNYTLGRGELHFAQFLPGTQNPGGERYLGNTPEFNATIESENLDHYSSDRGIREKDASIVLEVNRTATFITDNIDPANIALFFFGSKTALAVVGGTVDNEPITAAQQGLAYQLGMSNQNPAGARALEPYTEGPPVQNVQVTDDNGGSPTTFEEGDDYLIDMEMGRLTIVEGGGIQNDTDLLVSYKTATSTRDRVISGSMPIEGALRYIAFNPAGKNFDWYMPYVKLTPNGDYALKGDEWQQIPFNVEILRKGALEAIYIDGRPLVS